jgi:hypothetical protein
MQANMEKSRRTIVEGESRANRMIELYWQETLSNTEETLLIKAYIVYYKQNNYKLYFHS